MSFVAAAIGGSALIGAGASIYGANAQEQSNQQAQQTIQQNLKQQLDLIQQYTTKGTGAINRYTGQGATSIADYITRGVAAQQPFAGAGASALPTLESLITPGKDMTDVLSQIPGFKFAQDWGMRGINNAATTSGLGGNVLKAGADYSSGLAQNTWQSIIQALQGFTNTGASAAASQSGALQAGGLGLGSLYSGAGSSLSDLFSGAGRATSGATGTAGTNTAGLQVGSGNILASAAGGVGSSLGGLTNMVLLNNLTGGKLFSGGAPAAANPPDPRAAPPLPPRASPT